MEKEQKKKQEKEQKEEQEKEQKEEQEEKIRNFFKYLYKKFEFIDCSVNLIINQIRNEIQDFEFFTKSFKDTFNLCFDEENNLSDTMIEFIFDKWSKFGVSMNIK